MKSVWIALLFTALGFINHATAEITVEKYREMKQKAPRDVIEQMESYVQGVGRGMWLLNYDAKSFCPPAKFIAQGSNFTRWLDDAIDREREVQPSDYIELVLLAKMMDVFPCQRK